eukprot:m.165063 g.165063  ORF g.165063 m.165063 type:complete len:250 (-) comp12506_c0_seq1:497-1246(-)
MHTPVTMRMACCQRSLVAVVVACSMMMVSSAASNNCGAGNTSPSACFGTTPATDGIGQGPCCWVSFPTGEQSPICLGHDVASKWSESGAGHVECPNNDKSSTDSTAHSTQRRAVEDSAATSGCAQGAASPDVCLHTVPLSGGAVAATAGSGGVPRCCWTSLSSTSTGLCLEEMVARSRTAGGAGEFHCGPRHSTSVSWVGGFVTAVMVCSLVAAAALVVKSRRPKARSASLPDEDAPMLRKSPRSSTQT